ncbi:MAG: hypothetical protein Q8L89_07800 [Gammaproteobacteria bacterium]|nr:hypothetical protein [Gammaproteobacteria bacterium]
MPLCTSSVTLHGVFMDILDTGVLLCGASGTGKGELALELITRGHRLVADDAPDFRAGGAGVAGTCPPLLQDMLEVRGLGVLNIRALFGERAVVPAAMLALAVRLQCAAPGAQRSLTPDYRDRQVLGHTLPEIVLPLLPGRNAALLVETLVRDFRLRRAGYDAAEDFVRRQYTCLRRVGEA